MVQSQNHSSPPLSLATSMLPSYPHNRLFRRPLKYRVHGLARKHPVRTSHPHHRDWQGRLQHIVGRKQEIKIKLEHCMEMAN